PLKSGKQFKSFGNTTSGWGSGISLDQYLAQKLNPMTTFKSLQVGVHVRDTEVRARISYLAADQPVPPREDPQDVYNALFGAVTGGAGPSQRLLAQRKSVFDLTKGELTRLKKFLGTDDQQKLEAHASSIRDIEQRLTAMPAMMPSTGTTACAKPTLDKTDLTDDDLYLRAGRTQMDMAAAALACDQTRILTFQWSYSESEHLFQFLNINGNHHAISHDFSSSGAGYDNYNKIQTWYVQQFLYFLQKLDSYKEGDRTLLDNCVVLWATEIGESTQHDLTMMPYVLAGTCGGKLKSGRFLDMSSNRKDNNQMLVSLGQAMGDDLTSFGDPSGATGPLNGLT
ncbi:MAG TPA: DUF1552 domain-containing protein, partial [Polyangiaceae bacterium]|nr:DUF1552 domain-containing protein [Polyangiaceae bacterium]